MDRWQIKITCPEVLEAVRALCIKKEISDNSLQNFKRFDGNEYLIWGYFANSFGYNTNLEIYKIDFPVQTLEFLFDFLNKYDKITVGTHDVSISKDSIKIGCKTLTKEILHQIEERMRPITVDGDLVNVSHETRQIVCQGEIISFDLAEKILKKFKEQV